MQSHARSKRLCHTNYLILKSELEFRVAPCQNFSRVKKLVHSSLCFGL